MLYIQKMHNKVPCTLLLFVVLRTHLPKYLTIKYTSTFYVLSHRSHAHFATFNLPTIHLYGIWVHKIFNYYQPQCAWGIWYSGPEVQNTHFCGWWIFSKTIPWVNFSAMYQTKNEKTYMFSTSRSQFFCDVSTRKSNPSRFVFFVSKKLLPFNSRFDSTSHVRFPKGRVDVSFPKPRGKGLTGPFCTKVEAAETAHPEAYTVSSKVSPVKFLSETRFPEGVSFTDFLITYQKNKPWR